MNQTEAERGVEAKETMGIEEKTSFELENEKHHMFDESGQLTENMKLSEGVEGFNILNSGSLFSSILEDIGNKLPSVSVSDDDEDDDERCLEDLEVLNLKFQTKVVDGVEILSFQKNEQVLIETLDYLREKAKKSGRSKQKTENPKEDIRAKAAQYRKLMKLKKAAEGNVEDGKINVTSIVKENFNDIKGINYINDDENEEEEDDDDDDDELWWNNIKNSTSRD